MKVSAEIVHKAVGIVLEHEHLPPMGLAHAVALEPIFITTRLLTHLTIPSQLCKALSFDAVAYGFRGEEPATLFCLAHSSSRTAVCTAAPVKTAIAHALPSRGEPCNTADVEVNALTLRAHTCSSSYTHNDFMRAAARSWMTWMSCLVNNALFQKSKGF